MHRGLNRFLYEYLEKLNLNNRVDDPNIPTSALEMMIDFDEYRHSKFAADSKVGYNAYTEAVRILQQTKDAQIESRA